MSTIVLYPVVMKVERTVDSLKSTIHHVIENTLLGCNNNPCSTMLAGIFVCIDQ